MSIIQSIYTTIDTGVITALSGSSSRIITMFSPLVSAGFSLYVVLVLLDYARGSDVAESMIDFAKRMLKWTAIGYCALNAGIYNGTITGMIQGLGAEISSAFSTSSTPSITTLDAMFDSYVDIIIKIWEDISVVDLGGALFAVVTMLILIVSAIFFLVFAAFYITLSKFAVAVAIALGPVYIMTLFFPSTSGFFGAWLSTCINYILMEVLINIMVNIQISIFTANPYSGDLSSLLSVACTGFFSCFMLINIPNLATKLSSGGMALGGGAMAYGMARGGAGAAIQSSRQSTHALASMFQRSGGSIKSK